MAKAIPRVRFKKVSAKSLMTQIAGREPPYPVYRFPRLKFERPEQPGTTYRWLR